MNASANQARFDISEAIDNCPVGRFHARIYALCLICLVMDGFDLQALGFAAPALINDWGIKSPALGPVFGAGNLGVLVGALVFSVVADKVGRRPVLIGATLFFSIATLWNARVTSVPELLIIRFFSGIGLGCIIPNATALVGEYSPKRLRVSAMATISVGFTLGAVMGGIISAILIPSYGWRSVFYFGGAVPLAIAAAMFLWLPESLQFLVLRGKPRERVTKWLSRITSTARVGPSAEFFVGEQTRSGVPFANLFREGRALGTSLIWAVNFLNLLNLYFLSSWLPTVVRTAGYSPSTAVLVGTTLQIGGALGTLWLAWMVSRFGFTPVLTACFAVASLAVASLGQRSLPLMGLYVVAFLAGLCIVGGQPTINALSGSYYPTYLRSTGIGWGLGIGRLGAIIGPVLGGEFMRRQWPSEQLFYAAAVPVVITTAMMFSMRWVIRPPLATHGPLT
ncbi:MAG TPA: MFS transporter [Terriglobales bacterium]|nr:MFS transporter [Terriglobales bacterium]